MFKKYTSKIILVAGLFLAFFCFQNVNATTIYFEDDFDDYVALGPLSEYSNWFLPSGGGYSSPIVSSDNYVSAWNSLKFYYHDGAQSGIEYNFNSSLNSFYVSADILLETPSSFQQGSSILQFNASDGNNYNYVYFRCGKNYSGSLVGTIYYGSGDYSENNELVNQLCNGSFNKVSVYFERDYLNNRTIVSTYINGDLVSTIYDDFYQDGFYNIFITSQSVADGVYLDNFIISDTMLSNDPDPIDGVCGTSDGQTYSYPTTLPEDFCSAGELITPSLVYDGYGWTWSCSGLYGGESVSCEAYNSSPVDAVCGADDGGTFSNTSEMTEACSVGSLIFPSFVETSSGWTWICAGINGGSQAYCSATLSTTTYPTLPTQEDCSSYTFPDKWICEIKNLLTSAFLPSESKLNELNIAINSFQGKAPFNYLSSAINKFNDLKNGISESDLNITLMSNTSEVNLNDLTGLYDVIKGFFTIMVVLAFIFWGVGYIKHFFK